MASSERSLMDRNGRLVHAFSVEMSNLGFDRMTEHVVAMLKADAWREWKDGLGTVRLLPGEFDYFLSMCSVDRDTIMHGIRDVAVKARLQGAMDERRSGEDGYRRRYPEVRAAVGRRRRAIPFGYTESEGRTLAEDLGEDLPARRRQALGDAARRFAATGSTQRSAPQRSRVEQIEASVQRLDDAELEELAQWLNDYRKERKQQS